MIKNTFFWISILLLSFTFACTENKTETEIISVTKIAENAVKFVGKEVSITGTVEHVCKHGGKRLFIFDENDPTKRFKITAGPEIGTFKVELEGSDITVTGVINETRIDEAYLDNWESEVSAEKPEVAHEGHEHTNGEATEEEHNEEDEIAESLEKIKNMRETLEKSGKEFLAFYDMECKSFEEKK